MYTMIRLKSNEILVKTLAKSTENPRFWKPYTKQFYELMTLIYLVAIVTYLYNYIAIAGETTVGSS